MITFGLAEKLKEAGFPQKNGKSHEAYYLNAGENMGVVDYDMYDSVEDDYREGKLVYIPSLSELIEACGDKYNNFVLMRNGKIWNCGTGNGLSEGVTAEGAYNTPEEAVSKLWLELNKK